jgi:hypothetical protein
VERHDARANCGNLSQIPQLEGHPMETEAFLHNQQRLGRSFEPDVESCREADALPEPESWQLEDFQDILPHDLSELEAEYDLPAAYAY